MCCIVDFFSRAKGYICLKGFPEIVWVVVTNLTIWGSFKRKQWYVLYLLLALLVDDLRSYINSLNSRWGSFGVVVNLQNWTTNYKEVAFRMLHACFTIT